ncbi:hypothetical protein GF339_19535 [candidate division KSB3 bacterium]|uniref:Uncharacterized protein n=1 Tax=candidate division KSB3 bacterium TaxID=2044937 RepID=A0A9D5JZS1_9BACT|nr:hypothetical protein [candidate division KSB3 bacterium]MBD3326786.1 hypothetical protein [candidate division KSB3 bacterium]
MPQHQKRTRQKAIWLMSAIIMGWTMLWGSTPDVYGQLTEVQRIPTVAPTITELTPTIAALRGILQSQEAIQEQLETKEQEIQTAETPEQKARIVNEMNELSLQLEALERDFEEISTGVNLENFKQKPRTRFDWKEEIQDILGPLIEELKNITARPREIERLRNEVAYYQKRLPVVEKALENVRTLLQEATARKLKLHLQEVEQRWLEQQQVISNQLTVAQYQLNEMLEAEKPLVESFQNILRVFFKSRGRNLLLALLALVAVFLVLRYLHRLIYRISPMHRAKNRSFYIRLIDVIYYVLTFIITTVVFLLVLYISGDWVLLGLALIFLLGLAWTAKQGLPVFWEQIKLLLNLSTVREGERVIYHDLPWRVNSLNIYTKLHNPALKGGLIRLPLRELIGFHSRPFHKDEPWFPCQEEDFVLLADGTFGKVLMQTPETVQLLYRGSRKTYPTTEFLQQSPINLSTNFALYVTFGIDYQHQAIITDEIPTTLKEAVSAKLREQGYGEDLLSLSVHFKEAGASSLDVVILARFAGRVANEYYLLTWALQKMAVEVCNQHGWVIPFTQITLHHAAEVHEEHEESNNGRS